MGKKLIKSCSTWARLCGTHISETTGWIYTIRSSMELSGPVGVQHHGHLTLNLDFQGHLLKMLYLRNGRAEWHGTKGMWVDRMIDSHCDLELWPQPWPWPWIFKVNFWSSCISGTRGPTNMERKEYESILCYTYVTLSYDFNLRFWRSNLKKISYPEDKRVYRHGTKGMWVDRKLWL